jgi:hypothetical protein
VAQWACVPTRAASEPATQRSTPTQQSALGATKVATIADASAACKQLHANTKIPVTCSTDYVDNVPSMIVGFRDRSEAERWLEPFAEHIGNPLCQAANRSGREARVYMTIGEDEKQQARRWSCELGKWGDWFANAPQPERPPTPQTVADAIRACDSVQADGDLPVSCRADYVNGVSAMIVGFPDDAEAEAYMPRVAEQVAGPFCDAANRANRRASLYITLADSRARHYDCEQQKWGDWFELSRRGTVDHSSLDHSSLEQL